MRPHRSYLRRRLALLDRGVHQGHGAHHRRRHHREPAADRCPTAARLPIDRESWTVPPLSRGCSVAAASTTPRCSGRSTWAWAMVICGRRSRRRCRFPPRLPAWVLGAVSGGRRIFHSVWPVWCEVVARRRAEPTRDVAGTLSAPSHDGDLKNAARASGTRRHEEAFGHAAPGPVLRPRTRPARTAPFHRQTAPDDGVGAREGLDEHRRGVRGVGPVQSLTREPSQVGADYPPGQVPHAGRGSAGPTMSCQQSGRMQ